MFVIQRDDGAFVTPAGSEKSYTREITKARTWNDRDAADRERCVGNERVVPIEDLLQGAR